MTIGKFEHVCKVMHSVIRLLMMSGDFTLMKKYENGPYGFYLVTKRGMMIKITEEEYNEIYKAYYQERN